MQDNGVVGFVFRFLALLAHTLRVQVVGLCCFAEFWEGRLSRPLFSTWCIFAMDVCCTSIRSQLVQRPEA